MLCLYFVVPRERAGLCELRPVRKLLLNFVRGPDVAVPAVDCLILFGCHEMRHGVLDGRTGVHARIIVQRLCSSRCRVVILLPQCSVGIFLLELVVLGIKAVELIVGRIVEFLHQDLVPGCISALDIALPQKIVRVFLELCRRHDRTVVPDWRQLEILTAVAGGNVVPVLPGIGIGIGRDDVVVLQVLVLFAGPAGLFHVRAGEILSL